MSGKKNKKMDTKTLSISLASQKCKTTKEIIALWKKQNENISNKVVESISLKRKIELNPKLQNMLELLNFIENNIKLKESNTPIEADEIYSEAANIFCKVVSVKIDGSILGSFVNNTPMPNVSDCEQFNSNKDAQDINNTLDNKESSLANFEYKNKKLTSNTTENTIESNINHHTQNNKSEQPNSSQILSNPKEVKEDEMDALTAETKEKNSTKINDSQHDGLLDNFEFNEDEDIDINEDRDEDEIFKYTPPHIGE